MRYKIFGRRTGLRVSELALGTGNFGTAWGHGAEREEAKAIFDGYVEAGGNFIDTADGYQSGQSEALVGEFIASDRDHFVVATKYTLGVMANNDVSQTGNSRKNMMRSVEASLKRLKTDRIDLYWVHMVDGMTPTEEIMRGFDDLVRAGKILYAGLSNFPAWRVARAVTLAEWRGWAPIAGIQIEYSLVERTPDRELLPMAESLGLGAALWSPLGGGFLTGKYRAREEGRLQQLGILIHSEKTARETAILDAVLSVADGRRSATSP
jgi:aryl-alcohol dehydrogenase-like predicted oxidoreductase